MIARAVKRIIPGAQSLSVYPGWPGEVIFKLDSKFVSGKLLSKAAALARKFDKIPKRTRRAKRTEFVKPFSFVLSYE